MTPISCGRNPEFDEIVAAHGGILELESLGDPLSAEFAPIMWRLELHAKEWKRAVYVDQDRQIVVGFVCGTDINAFAYASPQDFSPAFDFIGISFGAVLTLSDLFARILAHPESFPNVGNPTLEVPEIGRVPGLSADIFRSGPSGRRPACRCRRLFGSILLQTAVMYLFFHELTHISHGHLEYLRQSQNASHWTELASSNPPGLRPRIAQTLEMDADCGAICMMLDEALYLRSIWTAYKGETDSDKLSAQMAAYGDCQRAVATATYAAYALFRVFDCFQWDLESQPDLSHPQPPVRMSWIGATAYEYFSVHPEIGYDPDSFAHDMAEIAGAVETDCARIQGKALEIDGIQSVYRDERHLEYGRDLDDAWTSIRPTLDVYKRGGNLPK